MNTELMSEKMKRFGAYIEQSYDNEWCFKFQPVGIDVVIVSHEEKERAASNFFIEFLKSIHYSIKWLTENNRYEERDKMIAKFRAHGDDNIDKTIEIALRQYNTQSPKQ